MHKSTGDICFPSYEQQDKPFWQDLRRYGAQDIKTRSKRQTQAHPYTGRKDESYCEG